jgi:hypothetical protein
LETASQGLPTSAHVFAVQPHAWATPPPPHVCGEVHVAHGPTVPPQPSGSVSQRVVSVLHVFGVHGVGEHTPSSQFGLPVGHVDPQLMVSVPHPVG